MVNVRTLVRLQRQQHFHERYRFSTATIMNIHARIQEVSCGGGGGPGPTDRKKVLSFFSVFLCPQRNFLGGI